MQVQLAMDELDRYRARVARIMRLKERKNELEINYTAVRGIDYSKVWAQIPHAYRACHQVGESAAVDFREYQYLEGGRGACAEEVCMRGDSTVGEGG